MRSSRKGRRLWVVMQFQALGPPRSNSYRQKKDGGGAEPASAFLHEGGRCSSAGACLARPSAKKVKRAADDPRAKAIALFEKNNASTFGRSLLDAGTSVSTPKRFRPGLGSAAIFFREKNAVPIRRAFQVWGGRVFQPAQGRVRGNPLHVSISAVAKSVYPRENQMPR